MPTYQYACTECGHQFEAVQSFADDPLTVCPACEGRLRKLYSSVGIVFKGSGFYRTDSRAPAKSEAAATKSETPAKSEASGSSSGSSDSGSSSGSTKSDSKPAKQPAGATS